MSGGGFFPLLVIAKWKKAFYLAREGAKSISTAKRCITFFLLCTVPVEDEGAEKFKMVLIRHCRAMMDGKSDTNSFSV